MKSILVATSASISIGYTVYKYVTCRANVSKKQKFSWLFQTCMNVLWLGSLLVLKLDIREKSERMSSLNTVFKLFIVYQTLLGIVCHRKLVLECVESFYNGLKEELILIKRNDLGMKPSHEPVLPDDVEIPLELICPITRTILVDPVLLHGRHFSREPLLKWLKTHKTNPLTNLPASIDDVYLDSDMANLVDLFVQSCKGYNEANNTNKTPPIY
jgi:hypothetical protein